MIFRFHCSRLPVFLLLMLVLFSATSAAQERELWYKSPAKEWTDAMPVGNGRLGAMVFGKYRHETIQINEESLWAGSKINNNNPLAKTYLPDIRKAVFEGQHQKVWDMSDKYLLGVPPEIRSYQPLGDVSIGLSHEGAPSDYKRSLNLNTGISLTEYKMRDSDFTQEVYISAPHDVMVVSLKASKPFDATVALSRDQDVDRYESHREMAWFEGQIRDVDSPKKGPGGKHMRFSAAMKILSIDGVAVPVTSDSSAGYRLSGVRNLTFVVTGATDFELTKLDIDPSVQPLDTCRKLLRDASRLSPRQLKNVHLREHRSWFERVDFSLGDTGVRDIPTNERIERVRSGGVDKDLIALYYQYGRYLLMSSSRKPGRLPANLQGIWNHLYAAKWNSDFHTNINLQMNYWPAETGNLSETSEILANFIKQLTVPGGRTAAEMYGARGWTVHHLTDVFGRTGVADGVWGYSPMAGPWLTFPVYRHFEFTGDENYLRETAYPIMKGSVLFVLDFLVESPEGFLVTNPSHSPENPFIVPGSGGKEKAYLSYATTIDIQIIKGLFDNFAVAAGILGIDHDLVTEVRKVEARLPPMKVGSNGTLQEWIHDYEEFEPGHRHISHLLGLYPLNLITPADTVLFDAARKTIERRMAHSQRHVGWSSAWIINFYARLLDGEKAGAQVQRLLQYSTLASLLNSIPPFQIDGNFGGAAGIAEMLLQSHDGVLHLHPALPEQWDKGYMNGLRARGNYTVDMAWRSGKMEKVVIHSKGFGKCIVRYNGKDLPVALRKGANTLSLAKFY